MDEKKKNIEAEILESTENKENLEKTETNKIENVQENKSDKVNETKKFRVTEKNKKTKVYIVLGVVVTIILIVGLLLSTIFALLNSSNDKILSGIHVKDIAIEGLTEDEAVTILKDEFELEKKRDITLIINGEKYSITPEQIEVKYNYEKAVEQAYNIGRSGNIFKNNFDILLSMLEEQNIDVEITYNDELLTNLLKGFDAKISNAMVDNTYCVENNELIITRGVDGLVIDLENAKQSIIENIKNCKNEEVEIKTKFVSCPDIDIDKIYSEVKSEPQNATYTTDPYEIIPHKNGLDFDLEKAREIISQEKEEYVIELIIIEPETLTNEIGEEAFPHLLSSFSTKYDETNVPRSKNLKLAVAKLNGVVIMPGEVFSYNKTLGKRTAEAGYEYANGFAGGKVVPMLAGGICQISSTLYDAVLYANLNIVERHNHMFQATYVDPGKDATVVYGSLDFKFENTRSYPIMLKATASGGLAEIKVFGIKEDIEYEIEIITDVLSYTPYRVVYQEDSSLAPGKEVVSQWGLQGCKSITYRITKFDGQEVSREVLSSDTYDPLNKIILRGPKKATVNTSTTPEKNEEKIETPLPEKEPEKEPEREPEKVPENEPEKAPEKEPETVTPENSETTQNQGNTENQDTTVETDNSENSENLENNRQDEETQDETVEGSEQENQE